MIKISLKEFQDCVNCYSQTQSSRESFLKISYEFTGGNIYGLFSDFGCGSWGVTTCVGGRCSDYDGEIYVNGKLIDGRDLIKLSCFISENQFEDINSSENLLSAKLCIEKAIQISKSNFTVNEIKKMFLLSDERFERDLRYVSGEIWPISIAVGFALGKDVFCYPWLNERDVFLLHQPTIRILKEHGKIILIPSNQEKKIKKFCDHSIIFRPKKYIFK